MDASIELYELNRSIIEQQGVLDANVLAEKFELINTFAANTKNDFSLVFSFISKMIALNCVFPSSAGENLVFPLFIYLSTIISLLTPITPS